jgi:isopentenyl-diphosphate delta-isomerase
VESVVLLDEAGQASGTADKMAVHHDRTPLHLAFSCYLFNQAGQFLLTRRAESKRTFPGVWTNTCCGHPQPGEPMSGGVLRRLRDELGIGAATLTLVLPRFRYRARMDNGVLENELCPVYAAYADDSIEQSPPAPDPEEVAEVRWVDWEEFCVAVRDGRQPVSPWCAMQLPELTTLGPRPLDWTAADAADLPPAALG